MDDSPTEQLRRLLRDRAIIANSVAQPLLDGRGRRLPWIYYHWNIGLDARGLELAAACLIARLDEFESFQLAGYGLTSLPLVTACVMAGGGRYSGLAVRKEPEKHGTRRQVEGAGDPSKPVVIIDDCIGSGRSLHRAMQALETAGYCVEGVLALVNFPWKGGMEWGQALGLKVATLFNVWRDSSKASNPIASQSDPPWCADRRLPDGITPAAAAREHILAALRGEESPLPPEVFDRTYDGAGGEGARWGQRRSRHRPHPDRLSRALSSGALQGRAASHRNRQVERARIVLIGARASVKSSAPSGRGRRPLALMEKWPAEPVGNF